MNRAERRKLEKRREDAVLRAICRLHIENYPEEFSRVGTEDETIDTMMRLLERGVLCVRRYGDAFRLELVR